MTWHPVRYGERHPLAILTEADVARLLARRQLGLSLGALAREFSVSKSQVGRIARGLRWTHLYDGDEALEPRNVCADALPALPAREAGQCPGARAFVLLVHALVSNAPGAE